MVLYAASVVWAAIVGMIYGMVPMGLGIMIINGWEAGGVDLIFGASLLVPVLVGVGILSLVKLIVLPKEAKAPVAPQLPAQ